MDSRAKAGNDQRNSQYTAKRETKGQTALLNKCK